ncbi:MAG: outer membrane lipoprotein LolB [Zoogloeaceae bacterium]|jgi:outer membrane biogenesis lipoprotein LolB|nr:outer membrane lipoprotein LolB [Zoogloeaceae bacterium]
MKPLFSLLTASMLSACIVPSAPGVRSDSNASGAGARVNCWKATETAKNNVFAFTARFNLTLAQRPQEKTERQFSGRLVWRRDAAGDHLIISDPLGRGIAALTHPVDGNFLLQLTDGSQREAADPEQLLAETLGVPLPLAELAAWVAACPGPGALVEADAAGRPWRVRESGWLMMYRYADESALRPVRLDASLESVLKLRLAFESWE